MDGGDLRRFWIGIDIGARFFVKQSGQLIDVRHALFDQFKALHDFIEGLGIVIDDGVQAVGIRPCDLGCRFVP